MNSSDDYQDLLERLKEGNLSVQEAEDLLKKLGSNPADEALTILLEKHQREGHAERELSARELTNLEERIPAIFLNDRVKKTLPFYMTHWFRYSVAAALLFAVAFTWLNNRQKETPAPGSISLIKSADLPPGHEGAILTLDDNSSIVLDSLKDGLIANSNGQKIRVQNGKLSYDKIQDIGAKSVFNTMTTPRGRQFQLTLPDGSKVWLDAASSIRFPTVFQGDKRRVEIAGEVYFEVAKIPSMPFEVSVKNSATQIEVLGTHFNVNAYTQETVIETTLFEGSVKIHTGSNHNLLKPGQQAQSGTNIKIVNDVNLRKVLAWKNGVFDFTDMKLPEVMQQLERWYDIDVRYEKGIPPLEFYGKMRRDLSLSEVLRGLEMSEVHFSMEGRTLIVKP